MYNIAELRIFFFYETCVDMRFPLVYETASYYHRKDQRLFQFPLEWSDGLHSVFVGSKIN